MEKVVGREFGVGEVVLAIEWLLGLRAPWDVGYIDPELYVAGQRGGEPWDHYTYLGEIDELRIRPGVVSFGRSTKGRLYASRSCVLACTCCGDRGCSCPSSAVHASCYRCRLHCQCHGGG